MSEWQPIRTAPKDGTHIFLQVNPRELPFIGYWGNPYRYVKNEAKKAWIGHEYGLHEDCDGLRWMPIPDFPER